MEYRNHRIDQVQYLCGEKQIMPLEGKWFNAVHQRSICSTSVAQDRAKNHTHALPGEGCKNIQTSLSANAKKVLKSSSHLTHKNSLLLGSSFAFWFRLCSIAVVFKLAGSIEFLAAVIWQAGVLTLAPASPSDCRRAWLSKLCWVWCAGVGWSSGLRIACQFLNTIVDVF